MYGSIEFTVAALKTTEGIGSTLYPKIDLFHIDREGKVSDSIDYLDQLISDMKRATELLKNSAKEIKQYSKKKAVKTLKELHAHEDLMDFLTKEAKKIKPNGKKESLFLEEFKNYCNEVYSIIGLLEIMCMAPNRREEILNHNGKPSIGSKKFNPKDFK